MDCFETVSAAPQMVIKSDCKCYLTANIATLTELRYNSIDVYRQIGLGYSRYNFIIDSL